MKLTKQILKQIIKEELEEKMYRLGPFSLETHGGGDIYELLNPIFDDIELTYGRLSNLEDQQAFEKMLLDQINDFMEAWKRQRKAAAE
jgi:hypothetical protein